MLSINIYRVSPKVSHVLMKITQEMSTLMEKLDFTHVLIFWIDSGLTRVSVIGTGGSVRNSVFFSIFTRIFEYFLHFTIFSCVEQIRNLIFRLK